MIKEMNEAALQSLADQAFAAGQQDILRRLREPCSAVAEVAWPLEFRQSLADAIEREIKGE